MNSDRLALIKSISKGKPSLSPAAAEILESIKQEDSDIGGKASFGEVIPADSVEVAPSVEIEDEENDETAELSPFMRSLYASEKGVEDKTPFDEVMQDFQPVDKK